MNADEMPIKYEAGYPGKDLMRSRAKNIMDEEMKLSGVRKAAPSSFSSPEKTKMRYYKKGGAVKFATGGALPAPKSPFESASKAMGEVPMKKGGGVRFADKFGDPETMKKGGKVKMAMGGMPGMMAARGMHGMMKRPMEMARPAQQTPMNTEQQAPMKKGGKVKKECGGGAMKMAMGGSGKIRHKEMTAAGKPINKKGSVRMK